MLTALAGEAHPLGRETLYRPGVEELYRLGVEELYRLGVEELYRLGVGDPYRLGVGAAPVPPRTRFWKVKRGLSTGVAVKRAFTSDSGSSKVRRGGVDGLTTDMVIAKISCLLFLLKIEN